MQIVRPTDIARKFKVGIAEVLTKIKALGLVDVSRTTKLPESIIERILTSGDSPDFWPTIRSNETRKNVDPESMGYGKPKKVTHIKPTRQKRSGKKKSRSGPPPILTPLGGQPGYKIGYHYK